MTPHDIAYIIFGVILIASFISVFFFTYVSKVEGQIVQNQMARIVNDLTSGNELILTPDQKRIIGTVIQSGLKTPDMSDVDAKVEANNNELKKKALKIFGTMVLVGCAIIAAIYVKYKGTDKAINLTEIVQYSMIILALVAATEFIFVSEITKNYEIIDPNYVRYLILDNFKTYSQT